MGLRSNPTYRQRRFGAEVRKLRERAGLSVAEAALRMGMKPPHLSNIEAGRTSLSPERLRTLAAAAGATPPAHVDALVELGQGSGKGWWTEYRQALNAPHLDLAELEAGAARLRSYELLLIPGLLQTLDYATAVYEAGYVEASPEVKANAVRFRMDRQKVLTGERPPRLHAIIHEAALRVRYGKRDVMRDQLLRLIEVSRLPNVTVQIFPLESEGRPALGSHAFMLVEPPVVELGTVIVDQLGRSDFLGEPRMVREYGESFDTLSRLALPPVDVGTASATGTGKDSLGLLQHILYLLL
ncbi:helix-turn-helix transcriptional regulator [Streptomyces capparidis]